MHCGPNLGSSGEALVAVAKAPGRLDIVMRFANTVDLEESADELTTPEELASWLADQGLATSVETVDARDLQLAHEARAALRSLIAANQHPRPEHHELAGLERVVRSAGLTPVFAPRELRLEPTVQGVAGALGRILAAVAEAMTAGTWSRLKLCDESTCAWAFYDESRNRSRRWCSMEVCGNRAKVRSYRARQPR